MKDLSYLPSVSYIHIKARKKILNDVTLHVVSYVATVDSVIL